MLPNNFNATPPASAMPETSTVTKYEQQSACSRSGREGGKDGGAGWQGGRGQGDQAGEQREKRGGRE